MDLGVLIYRQFYSEEKESLQGVIGIHVLSPPEEKQPLAIVGSMLQVIVSLPEIVIQLTWISPKQRGFLNSFVKFLAYIIYKGYRNIQNFCNMSAKIKTQDQSRKFPKHWFLRIKTLHSDYCMFRCHATIMIKYTLSFLIIWKNYQNASQYMHYRMKLVKLNVFCYGDHYGLSFSFILIMQFFLTNIYWCRRQLD